MVVGVGVAHLCNYEVYIVSQRIHCADVCGVAWAEGRGDRDAGQCNAVGGVRVLKRR